MQFHLLSFEGPDAYARAGGLASRVSGLAEQLAQLGFETRPVLVGSSYAQRAARLGCESRMR